MKNTRRLLLAFVLSLPLLAPAASFTVTSTNNSGVGSLRQAILDANLTPDLDEVVFSIPGAGPHTIAPLTPLPPITAALVIDGYTQAGASPNALRAGNNAVFKIELSGASAGTNATGLDFQAMDCVVRGLVINRFSRWGVLVEGGGSAAIEGNLIGTDVTGSVSRSNGFGISLDNPYARAPSRVGGDFPAARNVISGNSGAGVSVSGYWPFNYAISTIQGNFIGTDKSGTSALGNGGTGIALGPMSLSRIGGSQAGAGNVIAANGGNGINVYHRSADNEIEGNTIGTDLTGTVRLGNAENGIRIFDARSNGIKNNCIAANHGDGIRIGALTYYYTIQIATNSIFDNDGYGISSRELNYPVITNVSAAGGVTTISGTLNSTTNSHSIIEFFRNPTADRSGYGEGKFRLGATNVTINASGNGSFAFKTSETCAGQYVTATAAPTNTYATSVFCAAYAVSGTYSGNFQFKAAEFVGTEGGSAVAVKVVRTDSSAGVASVGFSTVDGTATAGSDYVSTNGTLVFAAGETNKTFLVTLLNDSTTEDAETLSLVLANAAGGAALGTVRTATLTIIDNDLPPAISIDDVSLTEGNGSGSFVIFTVSLSTTFDAPVSVAYTTASGSAVAGSDFAGSSGVVTFAPGETEAPVMVVVYGDLLNETDETFTVCLSDSTNATIARSIGTCTILNDDVAPQISINNVAIAEGDVGSKQVVFMVSLSAASGQTIQVDDFTADNTAKAGADYTAESETLVFPPGQTERSVSITILGDLLYEGDETFFVNLTNAVGATIADGQGVGTIVDDDPVPPAISINDVSLTEGNGSGSFVIFTVSLSPAIDAPVSVAYTTASGSAVAGSDFAGSSGVVTFAPGETEVPVTVVVYGDLLKETDETFAVCLSRATNATIARSFGTCTILNDDVPPPDRHQRSCRHPAHRRPPAISINDLSITEGNSGSRFAVFTVSLSTTNAQPVSVAYATANDTAAAGVDYLSVSGVLTFSPGEMIKPVTVTIKGDTEIEPNKTFHVNLSNLTNATLARASGTATIINDDPLMLRIERIANHVVISWSTNSAGFALYSAPSLVPAGLWQSVSNPVVVANGSNTITEEAVTGSARYYRLQKQ